MVVRIAIAGVTGRMGKILLESVANGDGCVLGAALARSSSPLPEAGELAGIDKNSVRIVNDIYKIINDFDVLIDFTAPVATLDNIAVCRAAGKGIVIGTTGFTQEEQARINAAAADIPVCQASNFSPGMNLCFKLIAVAAEVLGDDVDVEIHEAHHRHKIDAPSGTALSMGGVIADALNHNRKKVTTYDCERQADTSDKKAIGFVTVRAGDIVGDHTVIFAAEGERVEISHKASSRMSFAHGAVRAACWLADKNNGFFNMQDVLGNKE